MTDIRSPRYQFFLGPLTNVPLQATAGFQAYLPAEKLYAERKRDGGVCDNLIYSPDTQSFHLLPDLTSLYGQDMSLSAIDIIDGPLALTTIPGAPLHFHAYEASADHHTVVQSTSCLHENPVVYLSFVRYPGAPEDQSVDRTWSFDFGIDGDGFSRFAWSLGNKPTFTEANGTVHTFDLEQADLETYRNQTESLIQIHTVGDTLYILASFLRGPWIIKRTNGQAWNIPAGPWRMSGQGGPYAFHISTPLYATVGTLTTGWMSLGFAFDAETLVWDVLPAPLDQPYPPEITCEVLDTRNDGTDARFKLTVIHTGDRTPYIQALRLWIPPVFDEATDTWIDVCRYVKSASEHKSADITPDELSLVLDMQKRPSEAPYNGRTLAQYVAEELDTPFSGMFSCTYTTGYDFGTEGDYTEQQRLTGMLTIAIPRHQILAKEIAVKVHGHLVWLANRDNESMPCVIDWPASDALTRWLQAGGIPTEWIVNAIPAGEDRVVNELRKGYGSPQWLPSTGKALDHLKRLCDLKGYRVKEDATGHLYLLPKTTDTSAVATYSTEPGTDNYARLADVEVTADYNSQWNALKVIGKALEDTNTTEPPQYQMYDPAALQPGSDAYTGCLQWHVVQDDDLATVNECTRAAVSLWEDRPGLRLKLTAHYAGWNRWPGDVILVEDRETLGDYYDEETDTWYPNQRRCRVVDMTVDMKPRNMEVVLTCDVLDTV